LSAFFLPKKFGVLRLAAAFKARALARTSCGCKTALHIKALLPLGTI
jgi:hypothetical protein